MERKMMESLEEKQKLEEEREKQRVEEAEEEKKTELEREINEIGGAIPFSFFVRAVTGSLLVILSVIVFFVIGVVSISTVVSRNTAILLSSHRTVLLSVVSALALNIPHPGSVELGSGFAVEGASAPLWNDMSHITADKETTQRQLNTTLTFFTLLHQKVSEGGSASRGGVVTGDGRLDELTSSRTLEVGSALNDLMLRSVSCLMIDQGKCVDGRMQGVSGNFSGLEGLVGLFSSQALSLAAEKEVANVQLSDQRVQTIESIMLNDLRDGMTRYTQILIEEQVSTKDMFQNLLVVFFVLAFVAVLSGFAACILPTRSQLFRVAEKTMKMAELDGANDQTLQILEWTDNYCCDVHRTDVAHQALCEESLRLVKAIDDENKEEIRQSLVPFVTGMLACLADEEHLMEKYKIPVLHKKKHFVEHSSFVRRLTQMALQGAQGSASTTAVIQLMGMWISDHILKTDRDFASMLLGTAPQSDLEREIRMNVAKVPHSFTEYLESDNANLQDRSLFNTMLKTLGINAT